MQLIDDVGDGLEIGVVLHKLTNFVKPFNQRQITQRITCCFPPFLSSHRIRKEEVEIRLTWADSGEEWVSLEIHLSFPYTNRCHYLTGLFKHLLPFFHFPLEWIQIHLHLHSRQEFWNVWDKRVDDFLFNRLKGSSREFTFSLEQSFHLRPHNSLAYLPQHGIETQKENQTKYPHC